MMQKRTLYSLLLISFIAVFAASMAFADQVTFETKNVARCTNPAAGVTAEVTADSVSAIEIVFEISGDANGPVSFTWDATFTKLVDRVIDDTSGVDGVLPDTIRVAAMLLHPSDGALAKGTYPVGRVNFGTKDVCSGTINIAGVETFVYPLPNVKTQFVDAATSTLLQVVVNPGVVSIVNTAPTLDDIANATLHFGNTYTGTAVGHDVDACEVLAYSKVAGPAALTVNSSTGAISWLTTKDDICDNPVTIRVTDKCGAYVNKSFVISVTNLAPIFDPCVNPTPVLMGNPVAGTVHAVDPDLGPNALLYSVLSFDGPTTAGAVSINPATGAYTWPTSNSDVAYLGGPFHLKLKVTDGAPVCTASPANADTCEVLLYTVWGGVYIEKVHDQGQGVYTDVDVTFGSNYPLGGFDLLISYDASILNLIKVTQGTFITDCQWEYFTYRYGAEGNCGSACPSGTVRIIGMAETNNGNHHPACYNTYPGPNKTIAIMRFYVSNNRTYDCQYVPIKFWWLSCEDNTFSNVKGDTLIIANHVYNYYGGDNPYYLYDYGPTDSFPTFKGALGQCDVAKDTIKNKPGTWRIIDFYNGGIDLICSDSIDARGDINLNTVPNEIGDAVMFTNYFVKGLTAFGSHQPGSIAASDVNADGATLTIADLVYLIRIIVGDAQPYAKHDKSDLGVTVSNGIYAVNNGLEIGGVAMTISGKATPELLAKNMTMTYEYDGMNTHIVILPVYENTTSITGFTGDFIRVQGDLVSLEMATILGQPVVAKTVPKNFELAPNYPNPFNPSTSIKFAMPTAGAYTLTIYNVNGQVVKAMSGSADAGWKTVEWNATGVASGVYFYKLNAGSFSATRKMVLLK